MRSVPAFGARILAALVLVAAAGSLAVAATSTTAASHGPAKKQVLPWIEDDWTRAVALAKQRKVPIFVESWAPW